MQLSDHDLSQLDEDDLLNLPEAVLRRLSVRLLTDLKEARERLNQNSRNSSRPPSSEAPWDKERQRNDTVAEPEQADAPAPSDNNAPKPAQDADQAGQQTEPKRSDDAVRKPGKQPGAEGFGRQQS